MTSSPGTDGRSFLRPVEGPATSHPPAPLIFKVLPAIKSRDQVIATARDIARLSGRHMKAGIEPGVIYDEAACPVYEGYPPPDVARALLDEALKLWHLKPDEQNLSTTARALLASGDHDALKALPKGDRLRHRQAYQIIISVRASHDTTDGERLLEAVGDAVIDVFGGCGYRAFYALNTTGEHPNVRLLVCAQNRRPPYPRLRFSRYGGELRAMKQVFVERAREWSLNVVVPTRQTRSE